jgi:ribosomal protein S18 acetylase RimI-like enzyme
MSDVEQARAVRLRPAAEEDASAIYAIKRAAFWESSLRYTIYRSEKSVTHISRLIAKAKDSFMVAEGKDGLLGYAQVGCIDEGPILNYIAVADVARRLCLGHGLLESVESQARQRGHTRLYLDVFASNPSALRWYLRRGYRTVSQCFLYRIDLAGIAWGGSGIEFDAEAWRAAVAAEAEDGFSKVSGRVGDGEITLGLIAGNALKLLGYRNLREDEAIATIAASVRGSRSELIVRSAEAPALAIPLISVQRSLRMMKTF